MNDIMVEGMHGLGDNLHQRAIVRWYMRDQRVWLRTPWPSVYHDLVGERLQIVMPATITLRTQTRNAKREAHLYAPAPSVQLLRLMKHVRISYSPHTVRSCGSVLGAMLAEQGIPRTPESIDFRMPVPLSWSQHADEIIFKHKLTKPLMMYRPLVERTEWRGCSARNPDAYAYGVLADGLRNAYDIISIADIEQGKEWISGADIDAALKQHAGELSFKILAALTRMSALAFASPGFMAPLAQAVGTPLCVVFGGYEDSSSFALGAAHAPYLGIDTIKPCNCFSHDHGCVKQIDIRAAKEKLSVFAMTHATALRIAA